MFPADFYNFLKENTLVEIKGGMERPTFLPIWMVEVDKRIFARSWNRSERSWFTEFQKSGVGQIKYGERVMNVAGRKLEENDAINRQISEAYIKKYDQPQNLKYSEGISQPEYFNYTMEFTFQDLQ